MFKLGNDLVNFDHPRAKTKHLDQRFLNKVFTSAERQLILTAPIPKIALWAIWAAKEAAFKAYQKLIPELIFAYQQFAVELTASAKLRSLSINPSSAWPEFGSIKYGTAGPSIAIKWSLTPPLIHCLAVILIHDQHKLFNTWELIYHKIFKLTAKDHHEESWQTRAMAKKYLIEAHGLNPELEINREIYWHKNLKRYAPPMVFYGTQKLMHIEISLSHDHGWSAVGYAENRK